jgi:hypothetical protein
VDHPPSFSPPPEDANDAAEKWLEAERRGHTMCGITGAGIIPEYCSTDCPVFKTAFLSDLHGEGSLYDIDADPAIEQGMDDLVDHIDEPNVAEQQQEPTGNGPSSPSNLLDQLNLQLDTTVISFMEGGLNWFPVQNLPAGIANGGDVLLRNFPGRGIFACVDSVGGPEQKETSTPAPAKPTAKQANAAPAAKPKKGGKAAKPPVDPVEEIQTEGVKADAKAKTKTSEKKKSTDPLDKAQPIRVKSVPRSKELTDDQRKRLRAYFKLDDARVDPSMWKEWSQAKTTESKKLMSKARLANSIPRWAVAAVRADPDNLKLIENGALNKDNFSSKVSKASGTDCATEWKKLKDRFKAVGLFSNPQTGQEKALKKAYEDLKSRFPNNPSLPKLRQKTGKGSKDDKSKDGGKKTSTTGQSSGDIDINALIKVMMVKMISGLV